MAKKQKDIIIRLVSSAGTGYFYIYKKGSKNKEKLSLNKYDPVARKHVLFTEKKN